MEVLVHYGDLSLKGRNRGDFVSRLANNIRLATGGRCEEHRERIILRGGDPSKLKDIFGISWYAPCFTCGKKMDEIVPLCVKETENEIARRGGKDKTFAVFAKRADKDFPLKSSEIEAEVGEKIRRGFGLEVNIKSPDLQVHIRIDRDTARLHFERNPGAGGLPVGVSAPLLCLLSGGIDSPVASFLAMKRGCAVDFLHFHVFPDSVPVRGTKIADISGELERYQPESKMFLASYKYFQAGALASFPKSEIFRGYELVLFRRFMLKVAEGILQKRGYGGVVTGDCIGQVASQTVENMACAAVGLDCLVMSPLLGFDKNEIVETARRIGTYGHSTQPYNECCSIVSPSPRTRCRASVLRRLEEDVSMNALVASTLENIEEFAPASLQEEKSETG